MSNVCRPLLSKYVFSLLRETSTDSARVTSGGSEFQMRGAATLKARDATTNLVRGMTRFFFFRPSEVFDLEHILPVVL